MNLNPLFAFVMALAVSTALCAMLCRWSIPLKLVAAPRADRWHTRFTPNSGGIAIAIASLMVSFFAHGRYTPIAACAAGMAVLGFVDDRVQLRPLPKFLGQLLVGAMVASAGCNLSLSHSRLLNIAATILWIVGSSNAFNLIDNMDGLCAGTAVISCIPILAIALWRQDAPAVLFVAGLGGALLGFMAFNLHPARIFMGDCGSLFVGFSLACALVIISPPARDVLYDQLWIPALVLPYPIFDVLLVSFARTRAGRRITVGGRDHSSHRLVFLGLSQRRAVTLLWIISGVGASAAILTCWVPAVGLILGFTLAAGLLAFGFFLISVPVYTISDSRRSPARSLAASDLLRNP